MSSRQMLPKRGDTFISPDHFRVAVLRAAIKQKYPLKEQTDATSITFYSPKRVYEITLSGRLSSHSNRAWRVSDVKGEVRAMRDLEEWEVLKVAMKVELQKAKAGVERAEEELPLAILVERTSASSDSDKEVDNYGYQYPSFKEIEEPVKALMDTSSSLFIPPPSFIFPTSRSCIIHLWAVIRQRNLQIYRSTAGDRHSGFKFGCNSRHYQAHCKAGMVVKPVEGGWSVVESNEEHTHPGEKATSAAGPLKRGRMKALGSSSDSDSDSDESSDEGSQTSSTGSGVVKEESEDSSDESTKSTTSKEGTWRRGRMGVLYPIFNVTSPGKLAELVQQNCQSRFHPFPSPSSSISFASHQDFRLYALCSASQHKLSLLLQNRGGFPAPDRFCLRCTRERDCPWKMDVELKDGVWKCARTRGEHNHRVSSGKKAEKRWEKEYGKRVASGKEQEEQESTRGDVASTSRKRSREWVESLQTCSPSKSLRESTAISFFSRHTPPSPSQPEIPSTVPAERKSLPSLLADLAFAQTLTAFLYHLSPHLSHLSENLINLGVTSTEDMEKMLWWSEITFERFASAAGLNMREAIMMAKALERAKMEIED